MSLVALVAGVFLYLVLHVLQQAAPGKVPFILGLDGRRTFDFLIDMSSVAALYLEGKLSSPRLQTQMALIVIGTLFVAWLSLQHGGWFSVSDQGMPIDPAFALLWVVDVACSLGAAQQAKYHRLSSLALASGAGLVTCLTFVWFSAPDLALTQLVVEAVTVVLSLLCLRLLPRRIERDDEGERIALRIRGLPLRDFILAGGAGLGLVLLSYAVLMRPAD